MGTIPAPNIVEGAQQIAAAPMNQLQEFARVANLKQQTSDLEQQQQQRAQQMEVQRRAMQDQDALTQTIAKFDPAKHTLADIPKLFTESGGSGQGALNAQQGLVNQRKALAGLTDEDFAREQKKADAIEGTHDFVTAATTPEEKQNRYAQGLQHLATLGVDTSKEPIQYPGDEAFAQHLPAIRLHSTIVEEAEKDRKTTAEESTAETKALEAKTTAQRLQEELPGGKLEEPARKELRSYLTDPKVPGETLPVSERTPASYVAWHARQSPAAMVMGNMLGKGGEGSVLDQQAEKYFQSGILPSGFSRSPGTTAAIINRSNELHPGESLAGNEAAYKANAGSLKNIQKSFDQVSAFENTAQKNLDLYLEKLKAIPDLGVKFANIPLRMIDEKMIGSDNYQAMKAAQQTAASEAAKVLGSANASGVLSDSQKKEAEDMLSGNLSYSAAQKVVATLKQDFSNRHQSYQAQIADIQGRMGAPKPAAAAGGAGAKHVIKIGTKRYQYKGTGDTADLASYDEIK